MAVAIKNLGFTNIIIYNGGLKDWLKAEQPVDSIDPLPEYDGPFISAEEASEKLAKAEATGCKDSAGDPLYTLIDFRSSLKLTEKKGGDRYRVKTSCQTIYALLDEFIDNEPLINSLPGKGLILTISETGNRDKYLMKYLYKFGLENVAGLQFGMRGWLKGNYPVELIDEKPLPE